MSKGHEDYSKINIDGYKMVEDIYILCGLSKLQLPLGINRDWHPAVHNIYKKLVSGEAELPSAGGAPYIPDGTQFFIYERDPIDHWAGYYKLYLNDIFYDPNRRDLIHTHLKILKQYSIWEGDISEGPYVAMLPGREYDYSDWVVLLKQRNNGTTFVVSNYKLEYLNEYFVRCITIK